MQKMTKKFKSKRKAKEFTNSLHESGLNDVQIWELPDPPGKNVYVVLWDASTPNHKDAGDNTSIF